MLYYVVRNKYIYINACTSSENIAQEFERKESGLNRLVLNRKGRG